MKNCDVKVALLSSGLGHVKRGIESWTEDMGRSLVERGVQVTVFKGGGIPSSNYEKVIPCLQRGSKLSQWIIRHRPNRFVWRLGLGGCFSLEQMTFCWDLLPTLLCRQFDIIHTQEPFAALFCQRLSRLRLINSKVILGHGTNESFEFLNKFDYLQHLAPFHLKEAITNGVKNKSTFAIGNFVNTNIFLPGKNTTLLSELQIPNDSFVVLSVATIENACKRIDYLIREIASLCNSKIYLVVAGSRVEATDEVIRKGKELLGDRVVFLVGFERDRIPLLYASADLFALCTLKEMMSVAILEALSSGLPCLVHHYPVEEWMIGEGGESLDMASSGELARIIQKYFDTGYRREKAMKAREQAVVNFSKDIITDQILMMYKEVMGAI